MGGRLVAEHNGYRRLREGVLHRRSIELKRSTLEIIDTLEGRGSHAIEWRLHFSPSVQVSLDTSHCSLSWDNGEIRLMLDAALKWDLERGGTCAGWYSPAFNILESTTTLIGRNNLECPFTIKTNVQVLNED